jgi:hypothetical protein
LIAPVGARLSPEGNVPPVNDQLYGGVPPVAASAAEYALPTVPAGSELVKTARLLGLGLGAAPALIAST